MRICSAYTLTTVLLLCMALLQSCGKRDQFDELANADPGGPFVSADAPGAEISPELRKLKGRWVKEIEDWNTPNPTTMRLFASASHTLQGRFMLGGGFADTGIGITVVQEGDTFTLTLIDDEARPHESLPPKREFKGKYDAQKDEISFKSPEGEYLTWSFTPGYTAFFTSQIFRCVIIPAPDPSPGPGTPSGGTPSGGTPPSGGGSGSGSGSGSGDGGGSPVRRRIFGTLEQGVHWLIDRLAPVTWAMAQPRPDSGRARQSCGTMTTDRERWSRMSGAR